MLSKGVWEQIFELEDPELQRLAHSLPATVLHSRADSTTSKYLYAFQRWKKWAQNHHLAPIFPVREVHFALYLQHLRETVQSKSTVEVALNAISWVHQLAGIPPISESPFVQVTLSGLQHILAKPKVRKEPITASMLSSLVTSLGSSPKLSEVRLAAIALLGFSAFLRYNELAMLRCCDIKFSATCMTVYIKSSKTDQYRQGDSVMIARTGSPTCPVVMLERYFSMAKLSPTSHLHLFRGIIHTKRGERLRPSGSISYTRMRELFLEKLTKLGFNAKVFSLHSLRSGGASTAANAGVPDRLFKRHGRWKSESAKDGYVKDSVASLLSVSKSLDL